MPATTLNVPILARVSLNGSEFCFAKVQNQSTTETIRNDQIICGHPDPEIEGDAVGREINRFVILLDITVPILEALLPKLGTTLNVGTYESDASLGAMEVLIDYGATTHEYTETWVTRWAIRGGTSTMPISLELHCVATQEVDQASPTFTPGDMDFIYGFPGSTFQVAGTSYDIDRFVFVSDRNLVFEFNSSNYITGVGLGKRNTMLATSTPYLAAKKAVYWGNKAYLLGRDVQLALTNGTNTITFQMEKAKLIPKAPDILSLQESIRLPQTWEARRQVSPAAFAFTIAIT
jgi:hypothetical protein